VGLGGLEPPTSSLSEQRHRQTGQHTTAYVYIAPQANTEIRVSAVVSHVVSCGAVADRLLTRRSRLGLTSRGAVPKVGSPSLPVGLDTG
jgi:hypothetical protein